MLRSWRASCSATGSTFYPDEEARAAVLREVERIIDEDRNEGKFSLSIKATIVVGRKAE